MFLGRESFSLHQQQSESLDISHRCRHHHHHHRRRIESLLRSLPKNLHQAAAATATAAIKQQQQQQPSLETSHGAKHSWPVSNLEPLPEGENDEQEDDNDDNDDDDDDDDDLEQEDNHEAGLKIAWQYKKSVQQERLGYQPGTSSSSSSSYSSKRSTTMTDPFCHSYDLRYTQEIQVEDHDIDLMTWPCDCFNPSNRSNHPSGSSRHISPCAFSLYHQLVRRVEDAMRTKPHTVIRLFLYHLDASLLSVALPLFLTHIRTQGLPVVVLVALQSWNVMDRGASSINALRQLRRTCDVVLQCHGFAARSEPPPPEFGNQFQGFLSLPKMTLATAATAVGSGGHFADSTVTKRPTATRFGLKRDRRKLHIQLLHIPPEEYAQGGGSVGGGGVRSGAGQRPPKTTATATCASSGGSSPLDF